MQISPWLIVYYADQLESCTCYPDNGAANDRHWITASFLRSHPGITPSLAAGFNMHDTVSTPITDNLRNHSLVICIRTELGHAYLWTRAYKSVHVVCFIVLIGYHCCLMQNHDMYLRFLGKYRWTLPREADSFVVCTIYVKIIDFSKDNFGSIL